MSLYKKEVSGLLDPTLGYSMDVQPNQQSVKRFLINFRCVCSRNVYPLNEGTDELSKSINPRGETGCSDVRKLEVQTTILTGTAKG